MVPIEASMANSMPSARPTKSVNEAGGGGLEDEDDDGDDDEVEIDDKVSDVHETGPPVLCAYGP